MVRPFYDGLGAARWRAERRIKREPRRVPYLAGSREPFILDGGSNRGHGFQLGNARARHLFRCDILVRFQSQEPDRQVLASRNSIGVLPEGLWSIEALREEPRLAAPGAFF